LKFEAGMFGTRKLSGVSMPVAAANGIEFAYDDRGRPTDPAILLIMGLGNANDRLAGCRFATT